jgi:hypothetical protein
MSTLELETPPAGFEITKEWQDMPECIYRWARPIWSTVAGCSTLVKVPFVCGNLSGKLRKSWGKGNSRGAFVFMETPTLTFVINFKTKQIKIK